MNKRDEQAVLAVVGLGLIAGGHKLANKELGELGVPHLIGAVLMVVAFRT